MKIIILGLAVTPILCVSSVGLCALAPLPGTVLVGQQGDGVIRQYSASSGSLIGSLQVFQPDGASASTIRSLAYVNGQLLATASSLTSVHFGRINISTGALTPSPLSLGVNPTRIATRGNDLVQISFQNVFIYDSSLTFSDFIMLTPPPGTYVFDEVGGIAYDAIGDAFVTSNGRTSENNRVMYWRPDGTLEGQRNIDTIPDFTIASIDMDANSNDLFVTFDAGFSPVSYLRKYAFGTEAPLWSVPIPRTGPIQDIVYIPIPAPTSLLPTLVLTLLAVPRRRR